jgi:hypothetical protein
MRLPAQSGVDGYGGADDAKRRQADDAKVT